MYFEVQMSITTTDDRGKIKEVQENYMVDGCEFFAQAEQAIMQHYNGDCDVLAIKKSKVREFINDRKSEEEDIYVTTITMTYEMNGKTTKMKYKVALYATSIQEATQRTQHYMAQGLDDMVCEEMKKTDFIDVLIYN
jgi:hypothetical protein